MREAAKALGRALATVAAVPALASFFIRSLVLGPDRALEGSAQVLSLIPGLPGQFLRRAFLARVLARCDRTAVIQFGTLFSHSGARLDENVYVGPYCHVGFVHLERDVLLGPGVHIPSGPGAHGVADVDRPIRDQPGIRVEVTVGQGTWIGAGAIVLANVGAHAVVGAGAVVANPIPDYAIAVGVPARVVRDRRQPASASAPEIQGRE